MRFFVVSLIVMTSFAHANELHLNAPDCGEKLLAVQKDYILVNPNEVHGGNAKTAPTYARYGLWTFTEVSFGVDPQVIGFSGDGSKFEISADLVKLDRDKKVKAILGKKLLYETDGQVHRDTLEGRTVDFRAFEGPGSLFDAFYEQAKGKVSVRFVVTVDGNISCQTFRPYDKSHE